MIMLVFNYGHVKV